MADTGSMEDIQSLFKEPIAGFMEAGLEAELDDELGYSFARRYVVVKATAGSFGCRPE